MRSLRQLLSEATSVDRVKELASHIADYHHHIKNAFIEQKAGRDHKWHTDQAMHVGTTIARRFGPEHNEHIAKHMKMNMTDQDFHRVAASVLTSRQDSGIVH